VSRDSRFKGQYERGEIDYLNGNTLSPISSAEYKRGFYERKELEATLNKLMGKKMEKIKKKVFIAGMHLDVKIADNTMRIYHNNVQLDGDELHVKNGMSYWCLNEAIVMMLDDELYIDLHRGYQDCMNNKDAQSPSSVEYDHGFGAAYHYLESMEQ
jgi:hypothetical protein